MLLGLSLELRKKSGNKSFLTQIGQEKLCSSYFNTNFTVLQFVGVFNKYQRKGYTYSSAQNSMTMKQ